MSIDPVKFDVFVSTYEMGHFHGQRLGQAFYNEFKLHKMSDQEIFGMLYEQTGYDALETIYRLFDLQ